METLLRYKLYKTLYKVVNLIRLCSMKVETQTNMSNRKKGMRKGTALRQNRQPRNRSMISHPPPIGDYLITHKVKLRFLATNAFNGTVTYQNLLDTICIATSATALSDLFHQVKIRKIEVWSIAQVGTPASCSVQFNNGNITGLFGDAKFHTDTSMGIEPAYVSAKPSPNSLPDLFQVSSGSTAFTIECTAGSVIDVSLILKQRNAAQITAGNVGVGLTAGTLYFRGLDGIAIATSDLLPPSNLSVA